MGLTGVEFFKFMLELRKKGQKIGICSVCSAHPQVVEAAFEFSRKADLPALIESTSNQVNQFGGYTGMKPRNFRDFVYRLAQKVNFPVENIILGGDHLGPNPFRERPAEEAMALGCQMVEEYVKAGFTKIHLDASMYLGDDEKIPGEPLDIEIVAERTAELAEVAERASWDREDREKPCYVIGTEVPVPGGSFELEGPPQVTSPSHFRQTVEMTREAFLKKGLNEAWERVIAVVVQPGVEFDDSRVFVYSREKARDLSEALTRYPGLCFEGHSTDYQPPRALREMVEDGVAILKVGPALTFAAREAIFMLFNLEKELLPLHPDWQPSALFDVLERVMFEHPQYWKKYYQGDENQLRFAMRYSLFDRVRYYWSYPEVQEALKRLFSNLRSVKLPLSLLSQFFPLQYRKVRDGLLDGDPESLIKDWIGMTLGDYFYAVSSPK